MIVRSEYLVVLRVGSVAIQIDVHVSSELSRCFVYYTEYLFCLNLDNIDKL